MSRTVLVCCAHGTADDVGQSVVSALVREVRGARPSLDVRPAFVDVQEPRVGPVVADACSDQDVEGVVVVPLLLSSGFHVHVDIAEAVAAHPKATAASALGPHARLADLLVERCAEAGARAGDAVVVAAAGSSSPRAVEDVKAVADLVRGLWQGPVTTGFGSSASPTVAEAVTMAREGATRVVVASYLLAPGHFHTTLAGAGGDVVSAPLAFAGTDGVPRIDPRLVEIVLDRYDGVIGN